MHASLGKTAASSVECYAKTWNMNVYVNLTPRTLKWSSITFLCLYV